MLWLVAFWGGLGFTHNPVWHSAGSAVGRLLFCLGFALGAVCLFGTELGKTFRRLAVTVAILSILIAACCAPGLAE
jgi:hypothetical protein